MNTHELSLRFFSAVSRGAIECPRRTLLVAGLITVLAAPGIGRLTLRTDGQALLSKDAPEVVYDQEVRDRFGIEDQIVVLVRTTNPDGIFNPGTMQLVRELTAELLKLPGTNPSNLTSLATEPSFRMRPGTLVHQTLLEPPLQTMAELEQLREDLRRIELYNGTLIAADGKSTAILVGAPAHADRARLYRAVLEAVSAKPHAGTEEIAVTGAPVAESLLGTHILEDLGVPKKLLGVSTRSQGEASGGSGWYGLRLFIARRIGLIPVAVVVMMVVFLVSFRNVLAMLLPLPGVAATLVFVFGVMGWLGVPIYLTIAVMPVLLTATGVTNDIYLFNRYFTLLRERPRANHLELVRETFDRLACPTANTSLTTGIGFLSFGFSPLGPVRAFGVCTGVGVLFGLFYSLAVIPALLTLIEPGRLVDRGAATKSTGPSSLSAWFGRLAPMIVRHRWWVAGSILLVTALTPLGLRQLRVQDSWIDGFDPDSDFRRVTALVNEQYHGMHLLLVSFEAPQTIKGEIAASDFTPGGLLLPATLVEHPAVIAGSTIALSAAGNTNAGTTKTWQTHIEMAVRQGNSILARPAPSSEGADFRAGISGGKIHFEIVAQSHVKPAIIHELAALRAFIMERRRYAVGAVLGPWDYLTTTRFMARPNDPDARKLPNDAGEMKLMWDYYGLARGPQRLRQVVDTNYWRSLTTVFLKDANFADTAQLMNDIRVYQRVHLDNIKICFAGDVALSQSLIQGIVATQIKSLFWSLAGICVITSVLGGSVRWGAYCVLPSALAVLIKLALMGWFGIPLGVATSMFAAMTLGLGVNCAIQLLEGYGQARAEGGSSAEAISRAMALSGPPALINTVAVSLGFGVLMLSQVPANARLGLLVVLGLVECFVVSLMLLPVLLDWRAVGSGKTPSYKHQTPDKNHQIPMTKSQGMTKAQ